MSQIKDETLIGWGTKALRLESEAILSTADKISKPFAAVVRLLLCCQGNIVLTGLGKSGHVARKIASTLASTGSPAVFLHPAEAMHGDLGLIKKTDCLLAVAFGGETTEVLEVAKYCRRLGIPVIALTGQLTSNLAKIADNILDGTIQNEADPLNLAPTCSSTVAIAIGDALAVTLMQARRFSQQDFAAYHPGGSLGRKLALASQYMITDLPMVAPHADFHQVLEKVTAQNYGITAVTDAHGELIGCISDGDLRRALLKFNGSALEKRADELMSRNPKTVPPTCLMIDVMRIMEEHKISRLFVVSGDHKKIPQGIIRIQDLLGAQFV